MNKSLKYAAAGLLLFGLSSCLKDKGYDDGTTGHDLSGVPKIIEIGFLGETGNSKTFAYDFEDEEVTRPIFYVRLAADQPAAEDITVTLDTTGAYARIKALNPDYEMLPASFYTLNPATFQVVIPQGSRQVAIELTTNAIQFDPSTTYGLSYRATAVDKSGYNLSANYSVYTALFGAKNKYDGRYRGKGFNFMGTTNTTAPYLWTIDCDWELDLITTSGNSVYMNAQPAFKAPDVIAYNGIFPTLVFDPSTNLVTGVTSGAPGNAYNYGFPSTSNPGYNSRYDPATKTIYVSFNLINASWYAVDTLIYCGPR